MGFEGWRPPKEVEAAEEAVKAAEAAKFPPVDRERNTQLKRIADALETVCEAWIVDTDELVVGDGERRHASLMIVDRFPVLSEAENGFTAAFFLKLVDVTVEGINEYRRLAAAEDGTAEAGSPAVDRGRGAADPAGDAIVFPAKD